MNHHPLSKRIGLFLGPILFLIIQFTSISFISDTADTVIAAAVWMVIWWITEALHIAITALLPIILFPLSGGLALKATTASYGHKYIFLFFPQA